MEPKEALFILLAFLLPLAFYCLVLALVNRRQTPLLVPGPLDFLGVVVAVSGFLVVGGPAILSGGRTLGQLGSWARPVLLGCLVAYYALVVILVVVVLWWRRRTTAVYNVQPTIFEEIIGQALDGLGLSWKRVGSRLYVGPQASPTHQAVLDLEAAPSLYHVTVRWIETEASLRRQIEGELSRLLAETQTEGNPVAAWLFPVSSALFLLICGLLFLLLTAPVFFRR